MFQQAGGGCTGVERGGEGSEEEEEGEEEGDA